MTYFGRAAFIVCDNADYFVKREFAGCCGRETIEQIPASSVHPKENARIENFNKDILYTLARMIIAKMHKEGRDVKDAAKRCFPLLRDALFAYNIHVSGVTGMRPYQLVFVQEP